MPDAPNHLVFAEDFLAARVDGGPLHLPSLLAGAQGPDPLYFFGRLGFRDREAGRRSHAAGEFLHASDPADVFGPLCSALAGSAGSAGGAEGAEGIRRFSFLTGFLLHYILDRTVHPYVYYRSGFDGDGTLGPEASAAHAAFEAAMAQALHALLRPGTRPPAPRSLLGAAPRSETEAALASAGALLASAFPGRLHPGDYGRSWHDMAAILGILHDPRGIKAAVLDALGGGASQARAMIIPPRPPASPPFPWRDTLNLAGALWRRPDSGSESRATVPELYAAALDDALRGAALLQAVLDRRGSAEDGAWRDFLGGINHEGVRTGLRMRFSARAAG